MLRRALGVLLACLTCLSFAQIQEIHGRTTNTLNQFDPHDKVILAPDDSVYVVGRRYTNAEGTGTPNVTLRKITASGTLAWTNSRVGDTGDNEVEIYDGACDAAGNIYLVGRKEDGIRVTMGVLYKYSSDGLLLWSRANTPRTAPGSRGVNRAIVVEENSLTVAHTCGLYIGQALHLVRWDLDGNWVSETPGIEGPTSNTVASLVKHNGDWYVGGHRSTNPGTAAFLDRFNGDLQYVDGVLYQGVSGATVSIKKMAASETGEFALFGEQTISGQKEALLIAYDTNYDLIAENRFIGTNYRYLNGTVGIIDDELCAIGVGNYGSNGFARAVRLSSGSNKWTRLVNSSGTDIYRDVAIDGYGYVWICGVTTINEPGMSTMRLLPATGTVSAQYFENGSSTGENQASSLAIDSRNEIRVVGALNQPGTGGDGAYWHLYFQVNAINDTFDTPNNTPWELDTFANDLYVNDRATFTFPTVPQHGSVAMNAAKTKIVYTPDNGYTGPDTFTYTVRRGIYADSGTVTLNVRRMLTRVSADRNPIAGQNQTIGRVFMSTPAAAGGDTVAISDNSSLITTPTSVKVPAGSSTATFVIQVAPVNTQQIRSIYATHGGITREVAIVMDPLVPTAISFTPNPLVGGNTTSCKVVINGVAGPGGRTIAIVENSTYCVAPTTVTVPAGAGSVTFNITTTRPQTQQVVTIIARVTAGEKSATLRINP